MKDDITTSKHSTIDHWLVCHRWRNNIKDCNTQTNVDLDSDHFPTIIDVKIKLKAKTQPKPTVRMYRKSTPEQRENINHFISKINWDGEYKDIIEEINSIVENHCTVENKKDKDYISKEAWQLMEEKTQAWNRGTTAAAILTVGGRETWRACNHHCLKWRAGQWL